MSRIILIDFDGNRADQLQQFIRKVMQEKTRERLQQLSGKSMVLKQIQHSIIPFLPSRKPFDFSLDLDVALAMVNKYGSKCLEYLHKTLRNNPELISQAIKHDEFEKKKSVKQVNMEKIQENWKVFRSLDDHWRTDEEICRLAVECNLQAIRYVKNQELLNDRQFILEIVKKCGILLEFVGESLKQDKEIVLTALNQDPNAFRFVGEYLMKDEQVCKYLTQVNSMELTLKSFPNYQMLKVHANPKETVEKFIKNLENEYSPEYQPVLLIKNSRRIPYSDYTKTLKELEIDSNSILCFAVRFSGG